ncbi:hypothetical protein [Streptomyces sp. E-08]|uniref:hypothetical protein n=1 Tax=Streptomyces sp. E-08 TaxID=3404047 RepID=UPI003CEF7629
MTELDLSVQLEELSERLTRMENILQLQALHATSPETRNDAGCGGSSQSNHCHGNSHASMGCERAFGDYGNSLPSIGCVREFEV